MLRKFQTAQTFSALDWVSLGQAWFLLLFVDLGLRLLPFLKLQGLLRRTSHGRAFAAGDPQAAIRKMNRMVQAAANHHLYPMTCLRQALTLQWMLARHGICTELKIGVRKNGSGIEAHAWLEWNDSPIGQPGLVVEQFSAFGSTAK